jgi:hypothetical protein
MIPPACQRQSQSQHRETHCRRLLRQSDNTSFVNIEATLDISNSFSTDRDFTLYPAIVVVFPFFGASCGESQLDW